MHRRHFLQGAAAMAALPVSAAPAPSLLLLSETEAARLKPSPAIAARPHWVGMQRTFARPGAAWGSLFSLVLDQWQN